VRDLQLHLGAWLVPTLFQASWLTYHRRRTQSQYSHSWFRIGHNAYRAFPSGRSAYHPEHTKHKEGCPGHAELASCASSLTGGTGQARGQADVESHHPPPVIALLSEYFTCTTCVLYGHDEEAKYQKQHKAVTENTKWESQQRDAYLPRKSKISKRKCCRCRSQPTRFGNFLFLILLRRTTFDSGAQSHTKLDKVDTQDQYFTPFPAARSLSLGSMYIVPLVAFVLKQVIEEGLTNVLPAITKTCRIQVSASGTCPRSHCVSHFNSYTYHFSFSFTFVFFDSWDTSYCALNSRLVRLCDIWNIV
jgi:hypothetical protein